MAVVDCLKYFCIQFSIQYKYKRLYKIELNIFIIMFKAIDRGQPARKLIYFIMAHYVFMYCESSTVISSQTRIKVM